MSDIGHNGAPSAATDELNQFIEQIEQMESEEQDIKARKREIYAEAKARGYDVKVMRKVIRDRKTDPDTLAEFESVEQLYREAVGLLV
tara:strand:- start:20 stop:283 length:264 start_codon:yes stop_codon:yes gene_type:complete